MAIEYTTTVTETAAHARVYDVDGKGFHIEAVSAPPDFTALDTIEEELLESLDRGEKVNVRDLAVALVNKAKTELMGEILLRLLCILAESDNVKLDVEILISAAGLPIRDEPDSTIAARLGVSRQVFSIRKKQLMKRLHLAPPPHSKSERSCDTYRQVNRRNGKIE